MTTSQFKKFITSLEEEDLQSELITLYQKFKQVKDYYAMELGSNKDRTKIFSKAKIEIAKKYKTKSFRRPRKPRIRAINALLKVTHKKTIFEHEIIDLYLFNVEEGNAFLTTYRFISTPLHNTILNSYKMALHIINKERLNQEYVTRCEQIVANCTNYDLRRLLRAEYDNFNNQG